MRFVTAPDAYIATKDEIGVFLAGGITGCPNWQEEVKGKLEVLAGLVVYNPRQVNFDVTDPRGVDKQIKWEFDRLEDCDIFSMYFSKEGAQPICFYELGRYIVRMQNRFPANWKDRIIISYEDGFPRWKDVEVQAALASGKQPCELRVYNAVDHAKKIIKAYEYMEDLKYGEDIIKAG